MPNVIDSLIVSLSLDPSAFNTGQKQAVESLRATETAATRTAKSLQADGAKAAEFFSSIKTQAMALFGVLLGGKAVTAVVGDMTKGLADFGRTVGMIGGDPQKINAFEAAITRMGGSAETARGALLGLSKARQDWQLGRASPDQVAFMQAIGAMVTDDPLVIMEKFSGYIRRNLGTPQGEARIRQFGEGAGIGAVVPFMIQMEKMSSFSREMEESFRLGAVASKDQIAAATRFQTATSAFQQAVDGLVRGIIPFTWMAERLEKLTGFVVNPTTLNPELSAPYLNIRPGNHDNSFVEFLKNSQPGRGMQWLREKSVLGGSGINGLDAATRARAQAIHDDHVAHGMDNDTAWGFAANAVVESGARPNPKPGDGGRSHGSHQWNGDRLAAYVSRYGHMPEQGSQAEQNDFVRWELEHSERGAAFRIAGGRGAEEKAARISEFYERPAATEKEKIERARIARELLRGGAPNGLPPTGPVFGPPPDPALSPGRMMQNSSGLLENRGATNDNSSMVTIGGITVNTPATDTKGIVRDINKEMSDSIAAQSNRGLR